MDDSVYWEVIENIASVLPPYVLVIRGQLSIGPGSS